MRRNETYMIPDSLTHNAGIITAVFGTKTYSVALSGLAVNTRYQLYIVPGGTLVFSTRENSLGPLGYSSWMLIGSFYANGLSPVEFGAFVNIEGIPQTEAISHLPVLEGTVSNPNLGSTGVREARWSRIGAKVFYDFKFVAGGTGISAGSGSYKTPQIFTRIRTLSANGIYLTARLGTANATVPSTSVNLSVVASDPNYIFYQADGGVANGEFSNTTPANAFTASGNYLVGNIAHDVLGWSNTPIKDL